jgi:hypothetical protein
MKVDFKVNDKVTIQAEGNTHKELFAQLSSLTEVFGQAECGCCKGKNIRPVARKVEVMEGKKAKEYVYYEFHCLNMDCRARLAFGCHQEGDSLFPKKKDESGEWIKNNGWVKYEKPKD